MKSMKSFLFAAVKELNKTNINPSIPTNIVLERDYSGSISPEMMESVLTKMSASSQK